MLNHLKTCSKLFKKLATVRNPARSSNRHFSNESHVYPKRIFSGIQPTGTVHLGNYLGAIREWVRLQDSGEDVIWSIVDMHAITLPQDPKELQQNIFKLTATLLACGIDPERSILFQQSTVPRHAELSWILGCILTMPKLAQLPQFKEKSKDLKDIPLGLYIYPVLQAADILLYKATHVPVGEDQIQHLQLTYHLARIFNNKFGITFPLPEPIINASSGRIKSLREPTKKMSKSCDSKKSRIELTATPDEILRKIKRAVTDFTSEVTFEPETRPGVSNLVTIHSLTSGKSPEEICQEAKNMETAQYKLVVVDSVINHLAPIRQKYTELIEEPAYLESVLKSGTEKAMSIASENLAEIREKIGFGNGTFNIIAESIKVEAER